VPSDQLKAVLLDLGLEDWIPLPEAMADPLVVAATDGDDIEAAVREALIALLGDERIAIYTGRWDQDSKPVGRPAAIVLLRESAWYRCQVNDADEHRLYFVNVENIDTAALLADYKATATAWDLAQRDSARANPLFDRLYQLAAELRLTRTGRLGVTALKTDPNAGVRLMAATHSLVWAPAQGIDTLEQLARGSGLHAVSAEYTLKEFRAGTLRTDW
jgi:hypothetical protein